MRYKRFNVWTRSCFAIFWVFCVFIGNGNIHLHEEVYRNYAEIPCHVIDRCCSCVCCSLSLRYFVLSRQDSSEPWITVCSALFYSLSLPTLILSRWNLWTVVSAHIYIFNKFNTLYCFSVLFFSIIPLPYRFSRRKCCWGWHPALLTTAMPASQGTVLYSQCNLQQQWVALYI